MTEYPGKVRLVFKDLPLPFHEGALPAAEAARCAGEHGRFWEYHDLLFVAQPAFSKTDLLGYAARLGLPAESFAACLESGRHREAVRADARGGAGCRRQGDAHVLRQRQTSGRRSATARPSERPSRRRSATALASARDAMSRWRRASTLRLTAQSGSRVTRTIRLPTLSPCSRPTSAWGARSRPSTMSSRIYEPPLGDEPRQRVLRFAPSAVVVHHDEALHSEALHHEEPGHPARAGLGAARVVLRHRAAADDATAAAHLKQRGFEDRATDVVEVDVDPPGAGVAHRPREVPALVVDPRIEAQFVREPAAFVIRAGEADHPTVRGSSRAARRPSRRRRPPPRPARSLRPAVGRPRRGRSRL